MSDSTQVKLQLDTIHRQSKRLSLRLELPIFAAKDILAKAQYRCANWHDLESRLKRRIADQHIQLLAGLPHSEAAQAYFAEVRLNLARALGQYILANSNLAGLLEHIQHVFAMNSDPTTLSDLVPSLNTSTWRPTDIGPDPWAVVEAEMQLNGTSLKLVGTRIYWPRHCDFGPEHESGEYAEPAGGMLRIIWEDPEAWYQAALNYLDDLDAEDVEFPITELTDEMAKHQAWFEAALSTNRHIAQYQGSEDELLPLVLDGKGSYVVFGFPMQSADAGKHAPCNSIELQPKADNFSQLVVVSEEPLCLEWIAYEPLPRKHPGEFDEYFDELRQAILHGDGLQTTPRGDGQPGLLFVRPATAFDISQELKVDCSRAADEVALVLKTSNLTLARQLIAKVAVRDLMVYERNGRQRYFATFSLPSSVEAPNLAVSMESKGPEWTTMSNLVQTSYWSERDAESDLMVEISAGLLRLVDLLGKRPIDSAISHGLIQHLPIDFQSELDKPPARCKNLPPVPSEVVKAIERPLDPNGLISIQRTRYLRDSF